MNGAVLHKVALLEATACSAAQHCSGHASRRHRHSVCAASVRRVGRGQPPLVQVAEETARRVLRDGFATLRADDAAWPMDIAALRRGVEPRAGPPRSCSCMTRRGTCSRRCRASCAKVSRGSAMHTAGVHACCPSAPGPRPSSRCTCSDRQRGKHGCPRMARRRPRRRVRLLTAPRPPAPRLRRLLPRRRLRVLRHVLDRTERGHAGQWLPLRDPTRA